LDDSELNEGLISIKKAGVKNTPSTKIELNCNKIARMRDPDELARMLFPGNPNHQKVFLAVFIELKYAPGHFLPTLEPLCETYGFSKRILETVRSKMRRMGLIDHVSRFHRSHGYREGWVFSNRFNKALEKITQVLTCFKDRVEPGQRSKDRDLFRYV